jgi:hypothetical protein
MKSTPKTLEHWHTTAAASASEPISPAGLDKPDKSHRLRSGLLFESQWLIRLGLWELVCGMMILSQEYGLAWATVRFLALWVTVHISSLMGQHFCGVILQSAITTCHSVIYDKIDKRVDVW